MKKVCFFFVAVWAHITITAQDKLPAFGEIDKADLEMKTCDFDPDTDVVYLLDVGETVIYNSIDVVTEKRIRIKILKEAGLHQADIKLPFQSQNSFEQITELKGYTYNLDASGTVETIPLEQSMIFEKKLNKYFSEIAFAFPEVRVGTVIEFRYKTTVKSGFLGLRSWYFQKNHAVAYSSFHVVIPTSLIFTMQVVSRQDVSSTKPTIQDEGYWFTMKNIPGLRDEPYQAGIKD